MLNDHHYDNALQKPIEEINVKEFLQRAEEYYCSYSPIQKKYVTEWLKPRSGRRLALILVELFDTFSPSFRTPPCIVELERAEQIVLTERSRELHPHSHPPEPPPRLPLEEREAIVKEYRMKWEAIKKEIDEKRAKEDLKKQQQNEQRRINKKSVLF